MGSMILLWPSFHCRQWVPWIQELHWVQVFGSCKCSGPSSSLAFGTNHETWAMQTVSSSSLASMIAYAVCMREREVVHLCVIINLVNTKSNLTSLESDVLLRSSFWKSENKSVVFKLIWFFNVVKYDLYLKKKCNTTL